MNEVNSIRNYNRTVTIYTEGGTCRDSHFVYAAEYTKHNLIYDDGTAVKLNKWFNGHRFDARHNNSCSTVQTAAILKTTWNCKISENILNLFHLEFS